MSEIMLFIIGASGGLGSGLTEHLKGNDAAVARFGGYHGVSRPSMDLTDAASVNQYWQTTIPKLPANEPLYVINAAGRSINGFCHKLSLEDWNRTLADNLTANFLLVKSLTPYLRARPGSSILLFSSVVAELGVPGTIAYAASKSGLRGLVRTAAKELARNQATINCVELGYFDRGMIEQVPPEATAKLIADIPLGRLGSTMDLFQCCEFALSCRYLTGSTLKLNGGLI